MFPLETSIATAETLKKTTAENHAALEATIVLQLKTIHSKQDYAAVLKIFYGYFKPLEIRIEQFIDGSILPDLSERRKADFIINDLHFLGIKDSVEWCTDLPQITNANQALGALYVAEGSTLGGRGITKMLLKQTPEITLLALRFFGGYGENTGKYWIAFQKVLNEVTNPAAVAEMTAAANDTFIKFKQWTQQVQKQQ